MVAGWKLRKFKSGDQYFFTEIDKVIFYVWFTGRLRTVKKMRMATSSDP